MTRNVPEKTDKNWKPGDPLRLDQVVQQNPANRHIAEQFDRLDEAKRTHGSPSNHSIKPTNHKPFNRQKKG